MRTLWPAVVSLAALAWAGMAHAADVRHEPRLPMHQTSLNWSGYDVVQRPGGSGYRRVSATWIQPAVTCDANGLDSYMAVWVGLDGDGSATVEQTGTEADCQAGVASYSAWYELYPDYPVTVNLEIHPGDQMSALVAYQGKDRFRLTLTDLTTGKHATLVKRTVGMLRQSAEVIVEAPSSLFGVLPLAPFGTVQLANVLVDKAPLSGLVDADRIDMVESGVVKAETGPLQDTGFAVSWLHA